MKIAALTTIVVVSAKKTPENRLNRLVKFAREWCDDNLDNPRASDHWESKFQRNANRMLKAYTTCGAGKPSADRKRRDDDGDDYDDYDSDLFRYDTGNPVRGIHQITKGFWNWSKKYLEDCPAHPASQERRHLKFKDVLGKKYLALQN